MPMQPQDRRPAKKATSRRSAAKPTPSSGDEKYAATSWGAGTSGEFLEDLLCPSGQLALVRRPGVEGLLKAGVLHQLDSLTALVQGQLDGKNDGQITEKQLAVLLEDPEKLASLMRVLDKVLCYVVVKPEIETTPDDPTRRQNGVIYADMVDLMDKLFILNYAVGGTRDLERFREQHTASMGAVAAVQSGPQTPKRTVARKG